MMDEAAEEDMDCYFLRQPEGGGGGGYANILCSVIFLKFSALSKHMFAIEYHVYIWQVSLQLSSNINVIQMIQEVFLQDQKFCLLRN